MKNMDLLVNQFNPFDGTQMCVEADPEIFFPDYVDDRVEYLKSAGAAKALCNSCWVKEDCLEYALQFPDLQGIWGATTPHDRKRLRLQKTSLT